MDKETEGWEALYGPPASNPPHAVGETLFYDDCGKVENGTVLYVAAEPEMHYIVSPGEACFPTPVWPSQIITAM